MTIKEAILKVLQSEKKLFNHKEVFKNIIDNKYYNFNKGKTLESTVSALLGDFIRNEDIRIKRIKAQKGIYLYYYSKYEQDISIEDNQVDSELQENLELVNNEKVYMERDLHILLSTYLNNKNIFSKTIYHEKSSLTSDNHQKWIHPDMIGISYIELSSNVSKSFLKTINKQDTFKISSYEIKKEINTDYELKKSYFQAVSNSSWSNYGFLVAYEISESLNEEMQRLNQSFGIGIIKLKANPYESKVLFPSKFKELDFKTIDKLCKVNSDFEKFIEISEKLLSAEDKYYSSCEKELELFCDKFLSSDVEIINYCKNRKIPNLEEYFDI